ncbi:substrate-binding domain-containing protein [Nonomuraea sp. NPDC004580]|uniref:substrate-binding domain-containing protein n=1 Tax=Nonomuraea sp. NPDC004580 TaxID=3154552 RepID=UPI0033B1BD74
MARSTSARSDVERAVDLIQHLRPAVTAVRMPMYQFGRAGVEALHDLIAGRPNAGGVITDPEPELMIRDSATTLTRLHE